MAVGSMAAGSIAAGSAALPFTVVVVSVAGYTAHAMSGDPSMAIGAAFTPGVSMVDPFIARDIIGRSTRWVTTASRAGGGVSPHGAGGASMSAAIPTRGGATDGDELSSNASPVPVESPGFAGAFPLKRSRPRQ